MNTSLEKPWAPLIVPHRFPSETPGNKKMNAPGFLGPWPIPEPATAVPIASGKLVYNSFRIVVPRRASEVFSCGGADVTVIVSVVVPICSAIFTDTVLNASTITFSCTSGLNPVAETEMVYSPGGKGDNTYKPAPVVWRVVWIPVATLVAVTVALGI